MAKVQIVAGRRVVAKKPTERQIEKAHKTPAEPRVKDKLSGLSLKQMVRATPPYIKSNAEEVVIKALKEANTKGGLPGIRAKALSVGKKVRDVYDTSFIGKRRAFLYPSRSMF
jgi:hypothetical protein